LNKTAIEDSRRNCIQLGSTVQVYGLDILTPSSFEGGCHFGECKKVSYCKIRWIGWVTDPVSISLSWQEVVIQGQCAANFVHSSLFPRSSRESEKTSPVNVHLILHQF